MLKSSEVSVRLNLSGKYTWTISSCFPTGEYEEGLTDIKKMDGYLRNLFPDYVSKGNVRTSYIDTEE